MARGSYEGEKGKAQGTRGKIKCEGARGTYEVVWSKGPEKSRNSIRDGGKDGPSKCEGVRGMGKFQGAKPKRQVAHTESTSGKGQGARGKTKLDGARCKG